MLRQICAVLLCVGSLVFWPQAGQAEETRLDGGLLVTQASVMPSRSSFRHGVFVEASLHDRAGLQVAALLRDWMFGPTIHEENDPRFRLQGWYRLKGGTGTDNLGLAAHVSYDLPWKNTWQYTYEDEIYQHDFRGNWLRGTLQTRWLGDRDGPWRWVPAVEVGVSRYSHQTRSPHLDPVDRISTKLWTGVRVHLSYRHRFFVEFASALHGRNGFNEIYGQLRAGMRLI